MESKTIAATDRSPEVRMDVANRIISFTGEAYPEDAAAFWGPILQEMQNIVEQEPEELLQVDFQLAYFNSSSAKALMNVFQLLESAAETGTKIRVNWYFQDGDNTLEESGEDFSEDLKSVKFASIKLEP